MKDGNQKLARKRYKKKAWRRSCASFFFFFHVHLKDEESQGHGESRQILGTRRTDSWVIQPVEIHRRSQVSCARIRCLVSECEMHFWKEVSVLRPEQQH